MGTKRESVREKLAILQTENKEQTKKIDYLIEKIDDHIKTSDGFRIKVTKNSSAIFWMKLIGGGLFTIITILIWLVKS